mmetsp:Transcript_14148/g.28360  ORF Transcript_14148/g.28360 Transcript_14148/m.28360 type:complete len:105 (+) Transcript_14148:679-993(+)
MYLFGTFQCFRFPSNTVTQSTSNKQQSQSGTEGERPQTAGTCRPRKLSLNQAAKPFLVCFCSSRKRKRRDRCSSAVLPVSLLFLLSTDMDMFMDEFVTVRLGSG